MHVRNFVFLNIVNIDVPIGEHYSTLQQGQQRCTVVSSSDILLQLYCKILDSFRVPVS